MNGSIRDLPWGIQALQYICNSCYDRYLINQKRWHQGGILVLTYLAYTCYHLTRKPLSVAKNVLEGHWAPFDTADAKALLGALDSAFLFAYAGAMFFSGFIAERVNLRYFLSLGMLTSGISCYLFGIARSYNIHSLWYFVFIQAIGGIFQTSGWPGVVTVMGNWFGKNKRGLIFGIWNSHTSVGNILGGLIATAYLKSDWGLSFMVPGAIMGLLGFVIFLFLIPKPVDVGYRKIDTTNSSDDDTANEGDISHNIEDDPNNGRSETSPMLTGHRRIHTSPHNSAIGFMEAIKIPGVVEYSLSLFFAKFVSYTFLFWLPLYIDASTTYGATTSALLSILFDVGGIVGGIAAGVISDYSGMSALTCVAMFGLAFPTLFMYDYVGNIDLSLNIVLLLIAGTLVNGPYALITTAVSTELGTHSSLGDDSKALATVTAIIDGTGSIGAAIGPLLVGIISRWSGWHSAFYMLMSADLLALLFLSRLVYRDVRLFVQRRRVFHI